MNYTTDGVPLGSPIYIVTVEKGEYSDWTLVPFRSYARREDAEAFKAAAEAAWEEARRLLGDAVYIQRADPGGAVLRPYVPADWFALYHHDPPEYEVVEVSHDAPWPGKEV